MGSDHAQLQYIFERGEDWRVRQRSETLTLLDDGLSMSEVAKIVGIRETFARFMPKTDRLLGHGHTAADRAVRNARRPAQRGVAPV